MSEELHYVDCRLCYSIKNQNINNFFIQTIGKLSFGQKHFWKISLGEINLPPVNY